MGRHSPAVAELDRLEAARLRARALELVAELDTIVDGEHVVDLDAFLRWAGSASVILTELARG